MSGLIPRSWPAARSSRVEIEARSCEIGMPLASDAFFSAASERMISPTVRGFVARLWI
jgi:hypothetical protein